MDTDAPLLTIVIPTYDRAIYLHRAVSSALAIGDDVEVLVIQNGRKLSRKEILNAFEDDERIRVRNLVQANANAARNLGLELARGEFIRFLDDDDYLYPEVARRQTIAAKDSGCDVCSGHVDLVDSDENFISRVCQPRTNDIIEATLGPTRVTLVTAHLFRTGFVRDLRWSENLAGYQDVEWLFQVCRLPGITWLRFDEAVGVWRQHRNARISRGRDPGPTVLAHAARALLDVVETLDVRGELHERRRIAAATSLWNWIQKGLLYGLDPWRDFARRARLLAPTSKPPGRIYHMRCFRRLDPMAIALLLLPARLLLHIARTIVPSLRR